VCIAAARPFWGLAFKKQEKKREISGLAIFITKFWTEM
jgi:hypothetical protein